MRFAYAELSDDATAAQHAAAAAAAFQHLKPLCTQLLYLRDAPQQLQKVLTELQAAAADVDTQGLLRCFDYVTYPLLFMLDSIATLRLPATAAAAGAGHTPGSSSSRPISVAVPAMKSDGAAEAVLDCLLLLLRRVGCWLESDQVAALLQKFAVLSELNRQQAGEEIYVKILHSITALLQPQSGQQQQQQQHSYPALSAVLREPAAAPLAGILISQCLAAAAAELSCGSSGSRSVRRAAVVCLSAVVAAVGPGAPLATFLPGLASGISQQITAAVPPSGAAVTGAAADSTATVLLVQLLVQVIKLTLGNDVIQLINIQQQQQQQGEVFAADEVACIAGPTCSAADCMAALQQLSQDASNRGKAVASQQQQQAVEEEVVLAEITTPQQQQQQGSAGRSLRVECNAEWLMSSSSKIQTLLALTLPRLLTHPQPAVRAALAAAAADLLQCCSRALHNSQQALLEILLTLATDEYQQVAVTAVDYMRRDGTAAGLGSSSRGGNVRSEPGEAAGAGLSSKSTAAARITAAAQLALNAQQNAADGRDAHAISSSSSSSSMLGDLAVSLCIELPAAMRRSESAGVAAARRAAAAVLCAGPGVIQQRLLTDSSGAVIQQLCEALVATFQLEPSTAPLLLKAAAAAPGGDITAAAVMDGVTGAHSSTDQAAAAVSRSSMKRSGHPLLPRMPLSLKYLISRDSYMAAAAVARALGRAARVVDSRQQQQQQQSVMGGHSALQLITEQLLRMMWAAAAPHRHQQQQHVGSSSSSSMLLSAAHPGGGEWQCSAAAVVVVMTELIFGASAAWEAPITDVHNNAQQQQQQQQSGVGVMDAVYESVLVQIVSAVTSSRLWDLPTSNAQYTAAAAASSDDHQLPVQVLGANALLLRCLIDCVGAAARCAGHHFSSSSRLLRAALLPLLERLADPCPLVAAAAAAALDSICIHAGHPEGLPQLVGDNADYVIDGVCKRLRNLSHHPRAPQLLSCLLKQAGVGQQLLPLLAEPLRAALSGVSILARKQQPGYVLPFLHVLQSVAAGATVEAEAARLVFRTQLTDTLAAAAAAGLSDRSPSEEDLDINDHDDDHDVSLKCGQAAARYFKQVLNNNHNTSNSDAATNSSSQQQQQQSHKSTAPEHLHQQSPAAAAAAVDIDHLPALPADSRLQLGHQQLEDLELAWRRAYSAAALAAAAVEAATPLILQRYLRLSILAVSVLTAALRALAAATEALDIEERMFELLLMKAPDAALKPARPAPVKLLPAVHTIWPVLLACLQDTASVALIEQCLSLMAQMMKLAGGRFMARRFKQEAWPLLVRLLKQGPQAGAAALAAAAAAGSTGGGAAAAALLGAGPGPGGFNPDSQSRAVLSGSLTGYGSAAAAAAAAGGGGGVLQSALQSLGASAAASAAAAGGSSWNEAHGSLVSSEGHLQECDEQLAPATLQRVRTAALTCLQEICADTSAADAVQGHLIWDICVLAVPHLAGSQPAAVREAAVKLLVAAAHVDADAVWLLLLDVAGCQQDSSVQLLSNLNKVTAAEQDQSPSCRGASEASRNGVDNLKMAYEQLALVELQQILPSISAAKDQGAWAKLLKSDRAACGKHAAVLLQGMQQRSVEVGWHLKARQQLVQLRAAY